MKTYTVGFLEWGGTTEGLDMTLTFRNAKRVARFLSRIPDVGPEPYRKVAVYDGWRVMCVCQRGRRLQ